MDFHTCHSLKPSSSIPFFLFCFIFLVILLSLIIHSLSSFMFLLTQLSHFAIHTIYTIPCGACFTYSYSHIPPSDDGCSVMCFLLKTSFFLVLYVSISSSGSNPIHFTFSPFLQSYFTYIQLSKTLLLVSEYWWKESKLTGRTTSLKVSCNDSS